MKLDEKMIDELKRENKLLKREVERLKARLDVARDKEIKLLNDVIELRERVK